MWKYAALISYQGTDFCGWQKQKVSAENGHMNAQKNTKASVQCTIENMLQRMTGETISCVGSGRTDSGVHALGQVAHFVLKEKRWDPLILQRGLNGLLPVSIRVLGVKPVPLEFHAQKSAVKKQYSYYFQQGPCALPHLEPFSWWIQKRLERDQMTRALEHLVGEWDFKPFQASGAKPGPTVRRILQAEVSLEPISFPGRVEGKLGRESESGWNGTSPSIGLVRVRIIGTGFLKQMVRGIAGTLLQVGEGRRPASCMREILESRDRSQVGPTAPARALWLERLWYPESFEIIW